MRFLGTLAVFATIAFALQASLGHYNVGALAGVTAAAAILIATMYRNGGAPSERIVALALAVLIAAQIASMHDRPHMLYASFQSSKSILLILTVVEIIGFGAIAAIAWPRSARFGYFAFAVCGGLLMTARGLVIYASRTPHIDVFTIDLAAVNFLKHGINPYAQIYPDIYSGKFTYVPRLSYPPGFLALVYPATAWLGDPRWASVVCDIATASGIGFLAQRASGSARPGLLLRTTWLAFPVCLFVVEQAWADALALPFLIWAFVALRSRRYALAGVLIGFGAMTKQYALAAGLFAAIAVWRNHGWRPAARLAVAAAVTSAIVLAPFLAWDAGALYESVVKNFFAFAPRLDSLSWYAALTRWQHPDAARILSLAALLVALVSAIAISLRKSEDIAGRVAGATAVFLFVGFLFAKQAFCNYYYFVAGLVLAAAACVVGPNPRLTADFMTPPRSPEVSPFPSREGARRQAGVRS